MNKKRDNYVIDEEVDFYFYVAGWILIGAGIAAIIIYRKGWIPSFLHFQPCLLHAATGYYCFGCGGTRAAQALLDGKLLLSFFYHPFVPYAGIIGGWFMASRTIQYLSGNRWKIGMHFRPVWIVLALVLVVGNFLVKNGILLFTGIALMD